MFDLETNVTAWTDRLRLSEKISEDDVLELEDHLREEIDELKSQGLSDDEAFLISVKRMGNISSLSMEYSKVNTEDLWKNLLSDVSKNQNYYKDISLVLVFAIIAGTLAKIPNFFGLTIDDLAYFKNLSLFILPVTAIYFGITRKIDKKIIVYVSFAFLISLVIINLYPSYSPNHTEVLTALHLPLLLWLVTGIAYTGKKWKEYKDRMNFLRFTGESIIYGSLIVLGTMVLVGFTAMIFETISINISDGVISNIGIFGGTTAFMLTIYLVEKKKSVVENFAPILAKIFSPLFLITMITFLIVMIYTGSNPSEDRNFLIAFDVMLVLVLGLVIYTISARDINNRINIFDYINAALIITAIILDVVALSAIINRLTEYGISPNKLAALGENILLLINLTGLLWYYGKYFKGKIQFKRIEIFQTKYLTFYGIWFSTVVFIFPILFRFQ